jgi:tetratricopeptide (TPR) repeat protein
MEEAQLMSEKVLTHSFNQRFLSEARNMIGIVKMWNKDYDGAIKVFEDLIKSDPSMAVSYISLAEAKLASASMANSVTRSDLYEYREIVRKESLVLVEKALGLNKNLSVAYLTKGKLLAISNDLVGAVKVFKVGLSVIGDDISLGKNEKESMKLSFESAITNYSQFIKK